MLRNRVWAAKIWKSSSLKSAWLSTGPWDHVSILGCSLNAFTFQSSLGSFTEIPRKRDRRIDVGEVSSISDNAVPFCPDYTPIYRDLKSYQDTISSFGIPSLHERFEFIRQLGNVFLVRPEILSSYITENYLGRIDAVLLKPYLAQRSDWGQFEKGFGDVTNGTEEESLVDGKGQKDRFGMGRLSTMMKDLEGMKLGEGVSLPAIHSGLTSNFSIPTRAFGGA